MSDTTATKQPPQWRKLTELEVEAIKLLTPCTFPVASFDKRMANTLFHKIDGRNGAPLSREITERQAIQIWRLVYRYRRQISHPNKKFFISTAEKLIDPPFNKRERAASALKREAKANPEKKTSLTAAALEEPWATQFQKAQAKYKSLGEYKLAQEILDVKRRLKIAEEDCRLDEVERYSKMLGILESKKSPTSDPSPVKPENKSTDGNGRIISFD